MSIADGEKLNAANWQDFVSRLANANRGEGVKRHHTANPIFMVQKKARIYGLEEDFAEGKFIAFEDRTWYSPQEYWDDLDEEEQAQLNGECNENNSCDFLEYDQFYLLSERDGHTVSGYMHEWVYVNAHLTREAAEASIARKQHDYPPLRVFVESMCYGWEYQEIIQGILDGKIVYAEQGVTHD